jgi:RNA polymerase sigma factor (sigma-70 family)
MIAGCVKGQADCQKLLFDRFSGRMMSLCLRFTNNGQLAQDILQEGFIRVFRNIHQYRSEGSFEGWMRRLFSNVAAREISKQKLHLMNIDETEIESYTPDLEVVSKMSLDEIHILIRSLPDGYRIIFNLVVEGYSHEEIATILGIKATTSRGQFLRARKSLQALISKKYSMIII